MQFARSQSAKHISEDWHRFRLKARRNAFSKEEFGEIEQTKYDLDTARITGEDNDRNYTYNRPLNGEDGSPNNGTDVRTLNRH